MIIIEIQNKIVISDIDMSRGCRAVFRREKLDSYVLSSLFNLYQRIIAY